MNDRIQCALSQTLLLATPGWLLPLFIAVMQFEYQYYHNLGASRASTLFGGGWGFLYLKVAIAWLAIVMIVWILVLFNGRGNDIFKWANPKNEKIG
jgi:hypothetical protein